jgi:hypothetical protein
MSIGVLRTAMRSRRLFAVALSVAFIACGHSRAAAATLTVSDGSGFQAALDSAAPGDTILLQAGTTFVGDFVLPAKGGSGYITIRSSASDGALPAAGRRTNPAFASVLPKLQGRYGSAIITADGAHHWRFENVEFLPNPANPTASIILLGALDNHQTSASLLPHDIVFDRIYVHDDAGGTKRAIQLNSGSAQVINSYVSGIRRVGQEAQAICAWNGTGPFLIQNNYLEAAGENVLFGGADPDISGLIPSDITFRGNYVTKQVSWRGQGWTVKNVFELKNAQRVTIDGNVFEYSWVDAQNGYAVLFTGLNDSGHCTWCTVKDVTFTNNVVRHANGGFLIAGHNSYAIPSNMPPAGNNINIENNLVYDINTSWGGGSPLGMFALIGAEMGNVRIVHNTADANGSSAIMFASSTGNGVYQQLPGLNISDNLMRGNDYGITGDSSGQNKAALDAYAAGGYTFRKNVFAHDAGQAAYPSSTFEPSLASFNSSFVDIRNFNYRLTPSSAYKNAASDGRDIGVNMDALPAGVLDGSSSSALAPAPPSNVRIIQ